MRQDFRFAVETETRRVQDLIRKFRRRTGKIQLLPNFGHLGLNARHFFQADFVNLLGRIVCRGLLPDKEGIHLRAARHLRQAHGIARRRKIRV